MLRGRYKSEKHRQGRISKSVSDGGPVRSSDEGTVTVLERRDRRKQSRPSSTTPVDGPRRRKTDWFETKGNCIVTLKDFLDAYKLVKKNRGSYGVDRQSLEDFGKDLARNLYRLWNRVSSGCYYPPAVLEVGIPKDNGKTRYLGIPTVGDRIVQQVIKTKLEPRLERVFRDESYGYRPGKTAHQAIESVRQGVRDCWWAVDMDISAFFDEVSHQLLNLALDRHVSEPWIRTLINRWLEAPIQQQEDGELRYRQGSGTPQGGVISPLLANLFLHYVLDEWLAKEFPDAKYIRYADDAIILCNYEPKVHLIRKRVAERLQQCGLRINEEKTNVVFCKSSGRVGRSDKIAFDFLGYRFQPRAVKSRRQNRMITTFDCAISPKAEVKICKILRATKFHLWNTASIEEIADSLNPKLRGWLNYYGKFNPNRLKRVMKELNDRLAKWVCRKYKRFGKSARKAHRYLRSLAERKPNLFAHWQKGYHNA